MKQHRSIFVAVMIVFVMMVSAACGASNAPKNNTGGTDEGGDSKQRVLQTLKGDVSIPVDPKRVVALSVVYPDFLYALGVKPVAVQNYHVEFPNYLKEPLKDTVKMGIAQTPDFEMILANQPDLIIAPVWWSEKDYEQLSKIASTVLLPQRDDWRDELRDIADVFGKPEQAEKVIADLQVKEKVAKEKLHSLVGDETVMYMMIRSKEIIIYGENIDRGSFIHKTLGLKPVKEFPQSELSVTISLEKIPEYNPDHIILQLDDEGVEVKNRYEAMINSSLWKNMTAVKKDQVYMVGGKEWFNLGMSPLADLYAMDDVVGAFESHKK
ncbi:ABC transporter substrate-binding protein [Paenibacillus paeoniae]|uniref:ABC transporter substrate-binding protein n=1 Tax=Paenibacillus paeoniae TaxID=2292705 RepID=A0A371PL87_9BACL|nr:ABC transporter substrate-binding protein [Paenibacillus paeoniae]REK76409.1 ABC transporter substrate-binding protein [Paenibacillus paeoniae]